MKKNRDWLDYAELASTVGQNIQLGGIKSTLNELQRIEAHKQFNEQHLAFFRGRLFDLEDRFDALQGPQAPPPRRLLMALLNMEDQLRTLGRFTGITYEDRDRCRTLAARIGSTRAQAEKGLQSEVIADLVKASAYWQDRHFLEAEIENKKAVETIQKAKNRLNELTAVPPDIRAHETVCGIFSGSLGVSLVLLILGAINGLDWMTGMGGIGLVVSGIAYAASGGFRIAELSAQRKKDAARLKLEIAALEANAPDPDLDRPPASAGIDRTLPLAELVRMQQERLKFINRVMGPEGHTEN